MEFVVNEWLPEYLRGDADKGHNLLATQFLNKFFRSDDIIVVKFSSPFTKKLSDFKELFSGYPIVHDNYKKVIHLIFRDTQKARVVYEHEIGEIPKSTHELLHTDGTNYKSDYYLFETAHLCETKLIITTDSALKEFMKNDPHFKIELLEDFLRQY